MLRAVAPVVCSAKKRFAERQKRIAIWQDVAGSLGLDAGRGLAGGMHMEGSIGGVRLDVVAREGVPGGVYGSGNVLVHSRGTPFPTVLTARIEPPLGIGLQVRGRGPGRTPGMTTGFAEADSAFDVTAHDRGKLEALLWGGGAAALERFLGTGRPATAGSSPSMPAVFWRK